MSVNTLFQKYKDIFILNYLLIVIYFVVFLYLKVEMSGGLMFATVDSKTYWYTGQEFYKLSEKGYSELRPFFYPMILTTLLKLFDVYGVWMLQFILWIISANLLFFSIKQITRSRILSFAGSFIMAINISYIVLTFHALTETVAIFLLSFLVYFLARNINKINTLKVFHGCLAILALLTVTKPIFYIHLLLLIVIVLPFFYLKKYLQAPKKLVFFFLILAPVVFQVTMMKMKYNTISVSNIDSDSFRAYLLAQGVQHKNAVDLAEARKITKEMSSKEVLSYLFDNKMLYMEIYLQNLRNAIKSEPCFIMYPNSFYQAEVITYMEIMNAFYYWIHIIFFIPVMIVIFLFYRMEKTKFYLLPLLLIALLTYYILLLTGFSFREGDRHGIISLPLWIFMYILVADWIVKNYTLLKERKQIDVSAYFSISK